MFKLLKSKPIIISRRLQIRSFSVANYKTKNEPMLEYKAGSPARSKLNKTVIEFLGLNFHDKNEALFDIPIIIGDEEIRTKEIKYQVAPFDHKLKLARFYWANKQLVDRSIGSCVEARAEWEGRSFDSRAEIMLKAADVLTGEKRMEMIAAIMMGQGKTVFQAELDCIELIDFLRYNVQFLAEMLKYSPVSPEPAIQNSMFYRGLEGFVAAISPFNFTAIGGNLATAPAMMGNVVVWKPSDMTVLSTYIFYKILRECGLPAGVINFVPSDGPVFGTSITRSPHLAAINFTGSVPTFKHLWKSVAQNLDLYNTFPRLSGECGGKNFHLIHTSADLKHASIATICGAFEFSGQKCSATSRLYVPESKWTEMREYLLEAVKDLKVDSPMKPNTFSSAVIDERAFDRVVKYIDYGKMRPGIELVAGGGYSKEKGYFIEPTIFEVTNPTDKLMTEEIFGPVLSVYVYKDSEFDATLKLIDTSTQFSLTGSIFCNNEKVLAKCKKALRQACGNFYVNDKCTGAVVNQQPFGGARLSGTNDKPGGAFYLTRWTSPLSMKKSTQTYTSAMKSSR